MPDVRKIGDWEIVEPIQGGTNSLFKAKDAEGRYVAVKAIPLSKATEEQQARFLRETEIAKSLDHPNLVKVIASGSDSSFLFQVMELLDGSDLHKLLAAKTPLSWEQRLRIMVQVCDGLGYAHARGLVHRDLKPANLFLETSGRLRILDFGMARIQDSKLTSAGMALGTLNYMAPEQVRGETCTSASDVFSCGIIFYELIAGRHPFSHGSAGLSDIMSKMLFEAPAPLAEYATDVPSGIENVIVQALNKDPSQRPQNASELRGMLRSAQLGAAPSQKAAPRPAEDLVSTRKIRRPELESLKPPKPPASAPKPVAEPPKPVAAPRTESVHCPACARATPKGAFVCAHCGASLMATSTKLVLPKNEKKSRQGWLIGGIAAVLGLVLVVALLLLR